MAKTEGGKRLLPDTEAAKYLGLRVQTVRNWRHLGIGPAYHRLNGRTIRYDEDDLRRYLDSVKVEPDQGRRAG